MFVPRKYLSVSYKWICSMWHGHKARTSPLHTGNSSWWTLRRPFGFNLPPGDVFDPHHLINCPDSWGFSNVPFLAYDVPHVHYSSHKRSATCIWPEDMCSGSRSDSFGVHTYHACFLTSLWSNACARTNCSDRTSGYHNNWHIMYRCLPVVFHWTRAKMWTQF